MADLPGTKRLVIRPWWRLTPSLACSRGGGLNYSTCSCLETSQATSSGCCKPPSIRTGFAVVKAVFDDLPSACGWASSRSRHLLLIHVRQLGNLLRGKGSARRSTTSSSCSGWTPSWSPPTSPSRLVAPHLRGSALRQLRTVGVLHGRDVCRCPRLDEHVQRSPLKMASFVDGLPLRVLGFLCPVLQGGRRCLERASGTAKLLT